MSNEVELLVLEVQNSCEGHHGLGLEPGHTHSDHSVKGSGLPAVQGSTKAHSHGTSVLEHQP
jgi:hypothetical protein